MELATEDAALVMLNLVEQDQDGKVEVHSLETI